MTRLVHDDETGRAVLELGRVRLPVIADVRDPVSPSELASFDACEWRWRFEYALRLRPKREPHYFKLGRVVHAGLEAGYLTWEATRSASLEERIAVASVACEERIDADLAEWEAHAEEIRNDEIRDTAITEAREGARIARWIGPRYWRHYADDFDRFRVVEVERRGVVPTGRRTEFAFVRDLVLWDERARSLVLVDTKTSAASAHELERRVALDSQLTGYAYALDHQIRHVPDWTDAEGVLFRDFGPGHLAVGHVIYNLIRTTPPKEPKINKDGTVSSAAIATTAEVYQQALDAAGVPVWLLEARELGGRKAETAEARWAKIQLAQTKRLQALRDAGGIDVFVRIEHVRTRGELEEWRRETELLTLRVQARRERPDRAVRSRWVCSAPRALPCAYMMPCLEPDAAEVYNAYRVSDPNGRIAREGQDDGGEAEEE